VTGENRPVGAFRGYVLAGGASSRFGSDKARAVLGGETVLARMRALTASVAGDVQVIAAAGRYPDLCAATVPDRWPGQGPLGGIITALAATHHSGSACEWNLIVSCDMPFLTHQWLRYMTEQALASGAEVMVPASEHGLEPLCACWRTASLVKLQGAFDDEVRKVTDAMKRLRMEVLDETHWKRFDTAGRLFWNMNTPQDYEEAVRIWRTEQM
jgi:molybdopterin-guanine dinucleotide biosynthesis protein A